MLSEVRKKVYLDLFGSPLTAIPLCLGLCGFILSWAVGGVAILNLVGGIGLLVGVGNFISRLAIDGEKLVANQEQYEKEFANKQRELKLNQLAEDLKKDRDPRNDECLVQIRELHSIVRGDVQKGRVSSSVLTTVDQLFNLCVNQLEETYTLYCQAKNLEGEAKRLLLEDRETKINRCIETTQHLTTVVAQYREVQSKQEAEAIAKHRRKLDCEIEVTRRIHNHDDDKSGDFDKFMKEG